MEDNIKTNLGINRSPICALCPYRLYAKDDQNVILGKGNITSDKVIVLPSGSNKRTLEILQEEYLRACGRDIFEDCYVTQICKCTNKVEYNVSKSAIKYCSRLLYYELLKLQPKVVLFLGNSYIDYFENFNVALSHKSIKRLFVSYNPQVMLYDSIQYHNKFTEDLIKFING